MANSAKCAVAGGEHLTVMRHAKAVAAVDLVDRLVRLPPVNPEILRRDIDATLASDV
jgi:hypothetical protein